MLRLRWVIFWAVTGLLLMVISTALFRERRRVRLLEEKLAAKETALAALSADLGRSRERLEFYRTPEGKARLAREQFNLVLPGERLFRVTVESPDLLPQKAP